MVTEAAAVLAPPTTSATVIELSDDDSAAALFSVGELAPGHPTSSCMALAYSADGASSLRLYGTSAGSGLDRALHLVVDEGTGGRFGDCSAFTGAPVYAGTLADFARDHHDFASGLALGAAPSETPVSYRFTVEVLSDDTAQGRDAEATFIWEAQDSPPPPVTTTTAPPPPVEPPAAGTPTTTPTTTEVTPGSSNPTAPSAVAEPWRDRTATEPESARSVGASATDTEGATVAPVEAAVPSGEAGAAKRPASEGAHPSHGGPSGTAPRGGSRLTPVEDRSLTKVLGDVVEAVATAAVVVMEKSAFPGGLLVVAGLFLLAQDRIDRKDPKLALAPVYPDPDLRFDDFERPPVR
jgi:hypothetical protein